MVLDPAVMAGRGPARPCDDAGAAPQEQTQIITSAIGRPAPKAPTIINVNAESKFASACISRPDIPLLRQAPTGIARRPRMNDQECRRREKVVTSFEYKALARNQRDLSLNLYG